MRPFVYLLKISVELLDLNVEKLAKHGLTKEELKFLKRSVARKVAMPRQVPTLADAEIYHEKFGVFKKHKAFDDLVHHYLVVKRELLGQKDGKKLHEQILGMLFYVCDQKTRRMPSDPNILETANAFQEELMFFNEKPTHHYEASVKALRNLILVGEFEGYPKTVSA